MSVHEHTVDTDLVDQHIEAIHHSGTKTVVGRESKIRNFQPASCRSLVIYLFCISADVGRPYRLQGVVAADFS